MKKVNCFVRAARRFESATIHQIYLVAKIFDGQLKRGGGELKRMVSEMSLGLDEETKGDFTAPVLSPSFKGSSYG